MGFAGVGYARHPEDRVKEADAPRHLCTRSAPPEEVLPERIRKNILTRHFRGFAGSPSPDNSGKQDDRTVVMQETAVPESTPRGNE
jgi:hypothetical protein